MIDALDILHHNVPTKRTTHDFQLASGEPYPIEIHRFHHLLIGGNQLTVARVRGARRLRSNSNDGTARLEGLEPAVEDWHTRVIFLQVSVSEVYLHVYNTKCD